MHILRPYKVFHDCHVNIYGHPLDTKPVTIFCPRCMHIYPYMEMTFLQMTPTSVGVIYVTSTTDTRTRETTKSFKIGSALTPTRVNATQSQMRRQCTLMGILDTQRGSWVKESCAIG